MPLVPWTVPPDWTAPVVERLNWLTDYLAPPTGAVQKRKLRQAPRRGFGFDVLAEGRDRRLADALLFAWSGKRYALPIWHDIQRLASVVDGGADEIPCATTGYDFVEGGQALLWRASNTFELVTVAVINADSIELDGVTLGSWARGTRLYPVRAARIDGSGEERAFNARLGRRKLAFAIDEPCDWPAVPPATMYRDLPVLEHRSEEGQDPTSRHDWPLLEVDNQFGLPARFDMAERSLRQFDHRWLVHGRTEHSALRSLLYALDGRYGNLWVPTGAADLQVVDAGAIASTLTVEWCGYTIFGDQAPNRRDIRIEIAGGTVHHRRITASSEAGETELLTLDASLGGVDPASIRKVSFLILAEQASDALELQHDTDADGITRCATTFRATAYDL